jgi:DNA-binding PadR family transcriptional regulator
MHKGDFMVENTQQRALTETVFYILISLLKPRHGYAVMQNVDELTNGRVKLGAGTLYGAIDTLLEKRWIRAIPSRRDSRKKDYVVTGLGRKILQGELARLKELLAVGKKELRSARS